LHQTFAWRLNLKTKRSGDDEPTNKAHYLPSGKSSCIPIRGFPLVELRPPAVSGGHQQRFGFILGTPPKAWVAVFVQFFLATQKQRLALFCDDDGFRRIRFQHIKTQWELS